MKPSIKAIAKTMQAAEVRYDRLVPEGSYLIARLDGRRFTRWTRDTNIEKPFDETFRDAFIATASHLMNTGFKITYAYTQSDEISLLFDPTDDAFNRRHRKLISLLAGEASAKLALMFGRTVSMDCRLLELDSKQAILDYFSWRQADAGRNCVLSHVYWTLRRSGHTGKSAQRMLDGLTRREQLALLRDLNGGDYVTLPAWQLHGIGLYEEIYEHLGVNPLTGEQVHTLRSRIKSDLDLPRAEPYRRFLEERFLSDPDGC